MPSAEELINELDAEEAAEALSNETKRRETVEDIAHRSGMGRDGYDFIERSLKQKAAGQRSSGVAVPGRQAPKRGGAGKGQGRKKGQGFFGRNQPGEKAFSTWEKENAGLWSALKRAGKTGSTEVNGRKMSEEEIAKKLQDSLQDRGESTFNLNNDEEWVQGRTVLQKKFDNRLKREGFFTRRQQQRSASAARQESTSKALVPYKAPAGLVAGRVTGQKRAEDDPNVFSHGGRAFRFNPKGRRDPKESRATPDPEQEPGWFARKFRGAKENVVGTGKYIRAQHDAKPEDAEEAPVRKSKLDRFDDFVDRRGSRLARRPGFVGTFVGALRIANQKVRLLVAFSLAIGLLFIPVSFFTFAGWSIAASGMVLLSGIYLLFLNIVKGIASAFVAAINAIFSLVGGAIVKLTENLLAALHVGERAPICEGMESTRTRSWFCSGRQVMAEGFIPASELNALNIPLLDPKSIMPEVTTTTLFELIGRKTGLFDIDLGSFFAKAFGSRFESFVQTADIGWVIAVFLVPTVVIGFVVYVNFVRPALKDAGVIGRA